MPDPVVTAPPAAATSPAPDVAAASPSPEAQAQPPAKPKTGKARHDQIRAQLAAKKDSPADAEKGPSNTPGPAGVDAASEAKKDSQPATTEPEKPKPAVGAVMRLTAENTKLKGELDDIRGKLEAHGKTESLEALRARVKADPAVLFDVFGEDIDADENNRWTKLVESIRDRSDPGNAAAREVEKLKKQLAERDAKAEADQKTKAEQDRAQRRREHTAKILTEGFKDEIGEAIVDSSKYPYVNHLTKVGEVDAHAGISSTVRDMVIEFETAQKRQPTDAEIAKFIGIAAGEAETYFSKRARNWQLTQPAPAPVTQTEEPRRPTTIGSGFGGRDPGGVDTSKLTAKQKHDLIRQKLRSSRQQPAN